MQNTAIVEFVVLSEFDIDKGSCVRAQYPEDSIPMDVSSSVSSSASLSVTDTVSWDHYLADQMLPDGAEKHAVSSTMFVINRRKGKYQSTRCVFVPIYLFVPMYCEDIKGMSASMRNEVPPDETVRFEEPPMPTGASAQESIALDASSPSASRESMRWVRNPGAISETETEVACIECSTGALSISYQRSTCVENASLQEPCPQPDEVQSFVAKFFPAEPGGSSSSSGSGGAASSSGSGQEAGDGSGLTQSNGFVFIVVKDQDTHQPVGLLLREGVHAQLEQSAPAASPLSRSSSYRLDGSLLQSASSAKFLPSVQDQTTTTSSLVPLFGLSAAVTKKDTTARRGGINKSVAILGRNLGLLRPFFSLIAEAAEKCCDSHGAGDVSIKAQTQVLKTVFEAVNGIAATVASRPAGPKQQLSELQWRVSAKVAVDHATAYMTKVLAPFQARHTVTVPTCLESQECTLSRMSFTMLLDRFGIGLFHVIHSLLFAEKRVVFIGRTCNAAEVSEAAAAIGLLGNALYPEFFEGKVFPYTSINNMHHFSSISGFVVGTMNPMFEAQKSWWDVLCDVETGQVTVGCEALKQQLEDSMTTAADEDLCRSLKKEVRRLQKLLKPSDEIDYFVQRSLSKYLQTIASLASMPSKQIPVGLKGIRDRNIRRIQCFHLTSNFREFVRHNGVEECLLMVFPVQLTLTRSLEEFELMQIFQNVLRLVHTPEQIMQMLGYFPTAIGGLGPCAVHLLHPSFAIRLISVALLRRIESLPVGRLCISRLNSFLVLAYEQVSRDLPDTSNAY